MSADDPVGMGYSQNMERRESVRSKPLLVGSILVITLSLVFFAGTASAKTKITFWVIESFTPSPDAAIYQAVKLFNDLNPDIEVEVVPVPASVIRENFINASFGGGGPDVVALDIAWMAELAQIGLLQDITEEFSAIQERFFEGPATTGVYNGRAYAVPWYTNNVALFYNADMLAEVGYDHPPATWDEFLEISLALKEAGYYSLCMAKHSFAIFLWLPLLYGSDAVMVNEDGTIGFTSPEAVEAFRFFTDLYTKYGVVPETVKSANSWGELYVPFTQGRAAFVISGDWGINPIKSTEPDFRWSIAPIPAGKRPTTVIGGYNLAIGKNSPNREAAWQFIEFLTADENLWILEAYNRISALKAVLETEFAQKDPLMAVFFEQSEVGVAREPIPQYDSIMDILGDAFEAVIYGVTDVEDALEQAALEASELMSD